MRQAAAAPSVGRTGQIITSQHALDELPAGSVVVPDWLGTPTDNGINACTKFAPGRGDPAGGVWFRAIDNPAHPGSKGGVHPLGSGGQRYTCRVVYDPRDV